MRALALDMGGTHIGCAVVENQKILAHDSVASEGAHSLQSLLPRVETMLRALLNQAEVRIEECAGLVIGFPGIVDFRTATIHSTLKKYEDAQRLDLTGWCLEAFGLPMRIENDARMALLGEQYAGAAMGCSDLIMMTLGTGIGGAAMIHGVLLRGKHAQAGCLGGHLPVDFEGRLCACGNIGCAEAEAAGWSMPGIARSWAGFNESRLAQIEHIGFRDLFEAADAGDEVATAVRDRCLEVWASNAVANIHAYDPEVVVIGGGVMASANRIVPYIQRYVNEHAWSGWGKPEVRAAALGNGAAFLAAVPLLSESVNEAI